MILGIESSCDETAAAVVSDNGDHSASSEILTVILKLLRASTGPATSKEKNYSWSFIRWFVFGRSKNPQFQINIVNCFID